MKTENNLIPMGKGVVRTKGNYFHLSDVAACAITSGKPYLTPKEFLNKESTKELLSLMDKPYFTHASYVYACRQLVYAYALEADDDFYDNVLQLFTELHEERIDDLFLSSDMLNEQNDQRVNRLTISAKEEIADLENMLMAKEDELDNLEINNYAKDMEQRTPVKMEAEFQELKMQTLDAIKYLMLKYSFTEKDLENYPNAKKLIGDDVYRPEEPETEDQGDDLPWD